MKKPRILINSRRIILLITTMIVSIFVLSQVGKASVGIPNTEDSLQIQETIAKSYEIQQNAAINFDVSLFTTVFINDERGGMLSESTIDLVADYNPDIDFNYIGYLDYKIAYYNFWKQGATKIETLKVQTEMENRNLTREEMNSLIDDDGRMAPIRSQGPVKMPEIRFISILINENVAIATFDDGPATNEMTLVKINGQWYIAGNKFTSIHP